MMRQQVIKLTLFNLLAKVCISHYQNQREFSIRRLIPIPTKKKLCRMDMQTKSDSNRTKFSVSADQIDRNTVRFLLLIIEDVHLLGYAVVISI